MLAIASLGFFLSPSSCRVLALLHGSHWLIYRDHAGHSPVESGGLGIEVGVFLIVVSFLSPKKINELALLKDADVSLSFPSRLQACALCKYPLDRAEKDL